MNITSCEMKMKQKYFEITGKDFEKWKREEV